LSGKGIRVGAAAGVTVLSLLVGGFMFGGALVSAQEPTPQATQEAAPPTPEQESTPSSGTKQDRNGECDMDHEGAPEGGATGTGFRHHGPRTMSPTFSQ
jgi:hypothetical protein